jgi:hypothetical protein
MGSPCISRIETMPLGVSAPSDPFATAPGGQMACEAYRPGKSEQRNPFVKLDAADRD